MNETLRELLSMAPAMGAGLSGNGNAMQAFMEGFQKSRQQWEQSQRQKQQDELALQDRQRTIGRQDTADANSLADRERAAALAKQQDALRAIELPQKLASSASGAETPEDAKRLIESMMPTMMSAFGQEAMAFGQPAVEQATVAITGRQRAQMKAFVESWEENEHVENNQDVDPEIVNLTAKAPHIAKILGGRDSAKLSELKAFAQMAPGRKPKKPSEEVSWQIKEGIGPDGKPGMFRINPKTGATQPVQGIRPEPPRPTVVNTGANDARVNSRIDRITGAFNTSPIVKEFNEVQAQQQTIAQLVNSNWSGPADMSIVFGFMKALDPNSVVRETEYANAAKSGNIFSGWAARFNGALSPNGGFLSPQVKADFLRTIESRMNVKRAQYDNLRKQTVQKIDRIKAGAPETGDEAVTDYSAAFPSPDTSKDSADGGGAPKFVVGQKVRNRTTGEVRVVTAVRPDKSPVLGPVVKQ